MHETHIKRRLGKQVQEHLYSRLTFLIFFELLLRNCKPIAVHQSNGWMARTKANFNGIYLNLIDVLGSEAPTVHGEDHDDIEPSPPTHVSPSYGQQELNVFASSALHNQTGGRDYPMGTMVNSTNESSSTKSSLDQVVKELGFHADIGPKLTSDTDDDGQPVTPIWNVSNSTDIPTSKTVSEQMFECEQLTSASLLLLTAPGVLWRNT